MLVTVLGQQLNYKVTSHILERDLDNPNMYKMFHCFNCGDKVMQYSGDCIMSVPGPTPEIIPTFVPMMVLCRRCKVRHLFNSII